MKQKAKSKDIASNLRDFDWEGRVEKRLAGKQRLQIVQKLLVKQRLSKGSSLNVRGVDPEILRGLSSGIFDTLDIRCEDNRKNSQYDIEMGMKRDGERLPRGLSFCVKYDGSVSEIMEMDVTKPAAKKGSLTGMEGIAVYVDLPAESSASEGVAARLIERVDALLVLAGRGLDRPLSLN
jgi:hypothetical protein